MGEIEVSERFNDRIRNNQVIVAIENADIAKRREIGQRRAASGLKRALLVGVNGTCRDTLPRTRRDGPDACIGPRDAPIRNIANDLPRARDKPHRPLMKTDKRRPKRASQCLEFVPYGFPVRQVNTIFVVDRIGVAYVRIPHLSRLCIRPAKPHPLLMSLNKSGTSWRGISMFRHQTVF